MLPVSGHFLVTYNIYTHDRYEWDYFQVKDFKLPAKQSSQLYLNIDSENVFYVFKIGIVNNNLPTHDFDIGAIKARIHIYFFLHFDRDDIFIHTNK